MSGAVARLREGLIGRNGEPMLPLAGRAVLAAVGVVAVGVVVVLAFLVLKAAVGFVPPLPPTVGKSGISEALLLVAALVIAPLIETAGLLLLYGLASRMRGISSPAFIALCAGVGFVIHWPPSVATTPLQVLLFALFGWQLAVLVPWVGMLRAGALIALTHMVYNGLGIVALGPLWRRLFEA